MAELQPRDRLQPSLLDRLTDTVRTLGIELERARRALFVEVDASITRTWATLAARDRAPPARLAADEAALLPPDLVGRAEAVLELKRRARAGAPGDDTLTVARDALLAAWREAWQRAYARLHDPEHRRGPHLGDADLAPFGRLDPELRQRLETALRLEQQHRFERVQDRVLTLAQLEASVLRDLGWLLNCEHLAATPFDGGRLPLDRYPRVAASVLNYGTPSIVGVTLGALDRDLERGLAGMLRDAIVAFEPRLLADSVQVRLQVDPREVERRTLCFAIEADLAMDPAPLHLLLTSVVDLDDGSAKLEKAAG